VIISEKLILYKMHVLNMAENKKNTAYYRKLAYDAENKTEWAKAAKYYDLAIKHHTGNPIISQMARDDLEKLRKHRDQNIWAAKNLK